MTLDGPVSGPGRSEHSNTHPVRVDLANLGPSISQASEIHVYCLCLAASAEKRSRIW